MQHVIETNKLTKMYGKSRGIVDVDLTVNEGEIFGFIGPNGAGKSTTIRTLLGLIHKTSGHAQIFGKDCTTHKEEILQDVGYLPSEIFYYDRMKAIDLLNYSASFYGKDCKARIQSLAKRLDLDLNKKIEDMSLGNKKKVGIVQGLVHSPKLIILDEPTSGLDPLMQKTFFELIQEENNKGATILFSSHILSEVQKICDRVAIIKDGRVIQTSKIEQLQQDAIKKVSIKGSRSMSESTFELDGIQDLHREDTKANFVYRGDCNRLIGWLATKELVNVEITEPTLEEIFMHYYTDDGTQDTDNNPKIDNHSKRGV